MSVAAAPAAGAYQAITLSANSSLLWPQVSATAARFVAAQIDVTPTVAGLSLAMPDARARLAGPATIVANVGSVGFTLTDIAGASIAAIVPGSAWLISLLTNATAGGTWRALQFGSTSTTVQASSVADNVTIFSNSTGKLEEEQLTTSYSGNAFLDASVRGGLVILAAGSDASIWQLDSTANLDAGNPFSHYGWWCDIANQSSNPLTLIGTSQSINGAATVTINAGTAARVGSGGYGARTSSFLLSRCNLLTQNAVVLAGSTALSTPTTVAALGNAGFVLTSGGASAAPTFLPVSRALVPPIENGCLNGGCRVGARADAAITVNASTSPQYGQVDLVRLWVSGSGAAVTSGLLTRQSGNSFGSTGYSAQITNLSTTGVNATVNFGYRIEAATSLVFAYTTSFASAGIATFQILVAQNTGVPQTYKITINGANAANDFSAVTLVGTSSSTTVLSGVPTVLSFQVVLFGTNAINGIEMIASCTMGAATNSNFDFTDFGLFWAAARVYPYPQTAYAVDLEHCKRFLPRWRWDTASIATHSAYSTSTTNATVGLPLDVEARAAPSAILVSAANTFGMVDVVTGNQNNCTSVPTFASASRNALMVQAASTTNLTSSRAVFFGSGSAGGAFSQAYIIATGAEL